MNKKQDEKIRRELVENHGLTESEAREYLMERRYHGTGHEEALRLAKASPWTEHKN